MGTAGDRQTARDDPTADGEWRPSKAPRVRRLDWALGRLVSHERDGAVQRLEPSWSLPEELPVEPSEDPLIERVRRQLSPQLEARVPWDWLAVDGLTEFQRRVLEAASRIPAGETPSYGEVAVDVGCRGGARAVGQALRRNPFPPLIPCHRVVRADGRTGGYGGRSDGTLKRELLALESRGRETPFRSAGRS